MLYIHDICIIKHGQTAVPQKTIVSVLVSKASDNSIQIFFSSLKKRIECLSKICTRANRGATEGLPVCPASLVCFASALGGPLE